MKFKNMKISITGEAHLKAVCKVLGSIGYNKNCNRNSNINFILTFPAGFYCCYEKMNNFDFCLVTLTDLLRMRDEMVKENAKH